MPIGVVLFDYEIQFFNCSLGTEVFGGSQRIFRKKKLTCDFLPNEVVPTPVCVYLIAFLILKLFWILLLPI